MSPFDPADTAIHWARDPKGSVPCRALAWRNDQNDTQNCFHHVIDGERCSQALARSWSKTNLATSSRDMVPPWKSERSVSAWMVSRLGLSVRTEVRGSIMKGSSPSFSEAGS